MDLSPYVDHLRRELAVAAGAGGEEARALAERLAATLESATRLVLLEALSAAADEITQELAPGSVEVRLRGRDPGFVVTSQAGRSFEEEEIERYERPPALPPPADAEEGGTSRISLRVPEHLKPHIEEAAVRDGLSVNAWLVRAVTAALDPGDAGRRSARRATQQSGNRYRGWVR